MCVGQQNRSAHLLPLSVAGRPETNVDFTVVDVSCQQFILTVFCCLLIFQQCVRLTGCQHKRLLNGCLDILNVRLSLFLCQPLVSHHEGKYFLLLLCLMDEDRAYQLFSLSVCVSWKTNEFTGLALKESNYRRRV